MTRTPRFFQLSMKEVVNVVAVIQGGAWSARTKGNNNTSILNGVLKSVAHRFGSHPNPPVQNHRPSHSTRHSCRTLHRDRRERGEVLRGEISGAGKGMESVAGLRSTERGFQRRLICYCIFSIKLTSAALLPSVPSASPESCNVRGHN